MAYGKKPKMVHITDGDAVKLIHERADRETRTCSNAAAVTIIEHLGGKNLTRTKVKSQVANHVKRH